MTAIENFARQQQLCPSWAGEVDQLMGFSCASAL